MKATVNEWSRERNKGNNSDAPYGFRQTIEYIESITGMSNENYGARNARMNY